MQLSLNLPALERLLGGDTEIEIALRQQIVDEFAKKHLKPLMSDAALERVSAVLRLEFSREIDEYVMPLLTELRLGYKADEALGRTSFRAAIMKAIDETLAEVIEEKVAKRADYYARVIAERIGVAIPAQIDKLVEEGVQKRLSEALALKTTKG